jgi:L-lactate dehydrogenase complex protein LldG
VEAALTTRAEFMARLRRGMGRSRGRFPAAVAERPPDPRAAAEFVRRQLAERWPAALVRFQEEFERVAGIFYRVPTMDTVPGAVAQIARERGARRLVAWHPRAVGADFAPALAREGLDVVAMPDGPPDERVGADEARRLRQATVTADIGLTGVDLAIAETGTLVLVSGAGRPRSTSLLPPCHVAVFDRQALVETLEQVGIILEAWHADGAPPMSGGAINFITGPSRTADIELTLTRGVHGPKEVHAIFVDEAGTGAPSEE